MKIRTRISLIYTLLTAGIFLFFAGTIYYSAEKNREKEFFNALRKEALTKANLIADANVPAETLQKIYLKNREILDEVEVAIYNTHFELIYHDAVEIDFVKETETMLAEIMTEKSIEFFQEKWQVVGLLFEYKDQSYIITAAAYDRYGYAKMNNLLKTLAGSFILSLIVLYLSGIFLAKKAFTPVIEMTAEAKKISATNLDMRISEGTSRDELSALAATFNEMLDRLENSFESQKSFVSNIAHELRTPLSAVISELEWAAARKRTDEEYSESVKKALNDAAKLSKTITALLNLAKAGYDTSGISFKSTRADEILMDAITDVVKSNAQYKILPEIEVENENHLSIQGNEYLLKTAFFNLMENACKYSPDNTCKVTISFKNENLQISFTDKGSGIPEEDLNKIFEPFYRVQNTPVHGTGIGLSLTKKIIELHKGNISVASAINSGSTFTISLPSKLN
jgi:two-component system, OmpR family, sensor histidine kinase ArlS